MDQIKIGKFIAKCRKDLNMTQVQLGEKLGVSDKSVSKWENAKCMPDISLFPDLCEILGITINDLLSGEKVDKEYINTLEENFINIISYLEIKKRRKKKIIIITIIIFSLLLLLSRTFYINYELDVIYNNKIMSCSISEKELIYNIKGQSVLNTYYTSKKINDKKIYFFHNTINLYNKRRSNWEYLQSMINLLENKKITFTSFNNINIDEKEIEVYYTDKSIKTIKKADEQELKNIMKNSYLMCKSD